MDHPVTGLPFDYEKTCATCALLTDKSRTLRGVRHRIIQCAADPDKRNLNDTPGTTWKSLPACSQHTTS